MDEDSPGRERKLQVNEKASTYTQASTNHTCYEVTCAGWIIKWIVGATWKPSDTLYPELQLWRSSGGDTYQKINGTRLRVRGDTFEMFNVTAGNGIVMSGGIYEYDNFEPIPFQAGDILGVFLPPNAHCKLRLLSVRGQGPTNYYLATGNSNKSLFNSIDLTQQNLRSIAYYPLVSVSIELRKLARYNRQLTSYSMECCTWPWPFRSYLQSCYNWLPLCCYWLCPFTVTHYHSVVPGYGPSVTG